MDPDQFLEYRIVRLGAALGHRFDAATQVYGLSSREFSVLAMLQSRPEITGSDLARAVLTSPQAMAKIMDKLEQRGLLERPTARGRGRRAPTRLSSAGEELLARAAVEVERLNAESMATLDTHEREALYRALDALERLTRLRA